MAHDSIEFRRKLSGPNGVFGPDGKPFSRYGSMLEEMGRMGAGWRSPTSGCSACRGALASWIVRTRPIRRITCRAWGR
jgi:hypothetical protein